LQENSFKFIKQQKEKCRAEELKTKDKFKIIKESIAKNQNSKKL